MKKYLFPILYTLGILLVGSLLTSVLYYFNITSDKTNTCLLYLVSIVAIFTGSLLLGKQTNQKGIVSGIIYFAGWFLIMIIMSLLIFKAKINLSSFVYFLVLSAFSMLGGVIGKNNKEEADVS
ncbi:MAG: TIGR04086 family membrane protein [Bacilli bacterium]|nr:TIGR04086 family membrane protein [Bacilli bacterium]